MKILRKNTKTLFSFLFLTLFCGASLMAQQTSKSKSKEKLYEKGNQNKNVKVKNVKVLNSANTDYSPAYYQNGLVFVSSRQKNGPQDKKTGETFFELYFSPFDPTGDPSTPGKFSFEINSALHEGPATFARDFKTMYFTRSNMKKGSPQSDGKGLVRLKIYEARKGNQDWENVKELSFNDNEYSCMHPSLSVDGTKLYFSSDRPGGYGGFDLYVSERTNNGWSAPTNLGEQINTDKSEVFPFVHSSGTLFFSSDGHNSTGGLDIFFATNLGQTDIEVVNLGEPFNSPKDDLGVIMNDETDKGFFASNRDNGFGKDDIFSFEVENGIEGVEPKSERAKILITDAKTNLPVQGAAIRILEPSDEGFITGNNDFYKIDLKPLNENSNTLILNLVRKDANKLGKPTGYSNVAGESNYDFLQYRTYLILASANGYKTGERFYTLEPGKEAFVQIFLEDTPSCIEANGIVSNNSGGRLAGAALKLINKTNQKEVNVTTNINGGWEFCLPGEGEYSVIAIKPGFSPDTVPFVISKSSSRFLEVRLSKETPEAASTASAKNTEKNNELTTDGALHDGSVIVIDKIYYDYNKTTLNETATHYLDALCNLMSRYPEMEIDIVSYTDVRGDAKTNLSLSAERAENAKKYMVFREINANRINAIGMGEAKPRNHCTEGVNCTEEEHRYNRRTEIKVRKVGKNVKVDYRD